MITLEEVLYDQPTGRLALVFELMDANLYELIRGDKNILSAPPSLIYLDPVLQPILFPINISLLYFFCLLSLLSICRAKALFKSPTDQKLHVAVDEKSRSHA